MGAKDRELEAETGDGALEPGRRLRDDLLEPLRFQLEPRGQVDEEIDEGFRVAVERPPGKYEGLEVVLLRGKRLDLRGSTHSARDGGDARGDLHVILPGSTALGEDPAGQRQQLLLFDAQGPKIGADVEVGDSVGGLREELDRGGPNPGVAAWDVFELHRDVAEL